MEYEDNGYQRPTAEGVQWALDFGWTREQAELGFDIFDYDGTGMLEIEAINDCYPDGAVDDEACAREAERTGICKIIPVEELPENFPYRSRTWIDTPENRKAIAKYCRQFVEEGKYVYGTLEQCVDALWERIDWDNKYFPNFDFAANVPDNLTDMGKVINKSEGWFGCRDVKHLFDGHDFSLIFGYFGGGITTKCMVLEQYDLDEDTNKREIMECISQSLELCGYGKLKADDYTLFEFREEGDD